MVLVYHSSSAPTVRQASAHQDCWILQQRRHPLTASLALPVKQGGHPAPEHRKAPQTFDVLWERPEVETPGGILLPIPVGQAGEGEQSRASPTGVTEPLGERRGALGGVALPWEGGIPTRIGRWVCRTRFERRRPSTAVLVGRPTRPC